MKIVRLTNGHVTVGHDNAMFNEHVKHLIKTHDCEIDKSATVHKEEVDACLKEMRSAPVNYKIETEETK